MACKGVGRYGVVSAVAAGLLVVALVAGPAGPLTPWLTITYTRFLANDPDSAIECKAAFTVYGVSNGCAEDYEAKTYSEWCEEVKDWKAQSSIASWCDNTDDMERCNGNFILDNYCLDIIPITIFVFISLLLALMASIASCVRGCGGSGSPKVTMASAAFAGLCVPCSVIFVAVFCASLGDLKRGWAREYVHPWVAPGYTKAREMEVSLHAGFFMGILSIVLALVAAVTGVAEARAVQQSQEAK